MLLRAIAAAAWAAFRSWLQTDEGKAWARAAGDDVKAWLHTEEGKALARSIGAGFLAALLSGKAQPYKPDGTPETGEQTLQDAIDFGVMQGPTSGDPGP